nr:MAG TPA: hypothetical protein [Caudoviricetes sp.]
MALESLSMKRPSNFDFSITWLVCSGNELKPKRRHF